MTQIYQFFAVIFLSAILFISGCSQSSTDGGLLNQEPGADIDGDGILNENDVDVDGDGIPNALDPDDNNDGVLDELDLVPQPDPSAGVCKYLDIIPPNDEQVAGSTVIVKWKLYGANGLKKCVAPDSGRRDRALAYNNAALIPNPSKSVPVEVGARSAALKLPDWCDSKQAITYSLEGLAALLGQTDQSKGAFEALISHPPRSCSDGGETSCPDGQVIVDGQCVTPGGPEAIDCEAGEIEVNGGCEVPGGEGSYCPEGQVEIDGVCEIPSEGSDPNCPEGEIPIDGYCKVPDTGIDQPTPGLGCPGDLEEAPDGSCQCSGDLIPDDDNPLSCVAPWPLPNECAADEELIDGKCVSNIPDFFYQIPGCQWSGPVIAHLPQGRNTANQSDNLCEIDGWRLPNQDEMMCIWAAREVFGGYWQTSYRYWTSTAEIVNDEDRRVAVSSSKGIPTAMSPYEGYWRTCVLD